MKRDFFDLVNDSFDQLTIRSKRTLDKCKEVLDEATKQFESIVTEKHVFNIDSNNEKSTYSFYLDEAPQKGSVRVVVKGKVLTVEIKHKLKDNK